MGLAEFVGNEKSPDGCLGQLSGTRIRYSVFRMRYSVGRYSAERHRKTVYGLRNTDTGEVGIELFCSYWFVKELGNSHCWLVRIVTGNEDLRHCFTRSTACGYNRRTMLRAKVTIVGLGLMGGSLALALRLAQRMALEPHATHLTAVDANPTTRQAAAWLADAVTADFATGVRDAELVILATPVRSIIGLLGELARLRPEGCMVLDLGSTKADICQAMAALPEGFQAIGGHPMCGKETAGFGAATPDLYREKTFILCRNGRTTTAVETLVLELLDIVGARPLFLPPDLHDTIVAGVSHLPYVVAGTLMRAAYAMGDERAWTVSASGFRDTARVAGTDPRMMLDILLTNKTAVLAQLQRYQAELTDAIALLQAGDEAALAAWLAGTQRQYQEYRTAKDEG